MVLILFLIAFLAISAILLWRCKVIVESDGNFQTDNPYNVTFVKGSARSSLRMLVSNSMIELKRKVLQKKSSRC